MRKDILIRKIDKKNIITIYILVTNCFKVENTLFALDFLFVIPNFFLVVITLFQKSHLAESGYFPTKI